MRLQGWWVAVRGLSGMVLGLAGMLACTHEIRTEVFHVRYNADALVKLQLSEADADLLTQRILNQYENSSGEKTPQGIAVAHGARTYQLADYAQWKKAVADPADRQAMLKNGYKPWIVRVK